MSELLVLVGSDRRKGNSDLLGRIALREARGIYDRGDLIYLKDYELLPCNGCMACAFKEKICPLEDDFYSLLGRINQASHLLVIAPTYVLLPPARFKLLLDRYIAAYPRLKRVRRFGASVAVIALRDYQQFQIPILNLLLLAFGFEPVATAEFCGAGPGEVLLEPQLKKRMRDLLVTLKEGEKKTEDGRCPYCLSSLLIFENGRFSCPICDVEVVVEKGIPHFKGEPRWNPDRQQDHYENRILKTKDRFLSLLKQINRRKREISL